jgi:hypothetical protein
MMLREAADISAAADRDVLVVRSCDSVDYATFDLKRADFDKMLCGYRMWMTWPSEGAWLIPTVCEDEHVRMTPIGLEVHDRAPFASDWDRQKGLAHAREFLSVAVQGWF